VSYNEKHNEANGEDNNDGESHNRSWNCGAEGPTKNRKINALRRRQQRNVLTTVLLSQGVPMLLHGDELGRTQGGNNNAYCQDNEVSWIDWKLDQDQVDLITFTQQLVRLRREHPVLRRRRFFAGSASHGGESEIGEIAWFEPNGTHMDEDSWANGYARSVMVFFNGQAIPELDTRGQRTVDDHFLVIFNAHSEPLDFTLPDADYGDGWTVVVDTAVDEKGEGKTYSPGDTVVAQDRSTVVLLCPRPAPSGAPGGAAIARR
jgi:glycogen operon protein